jgi:cell fate regulator YaaT (PSP1 superfamily)
MKIAGVRFRENWRIYDFDATDVEVKVGDDVIVESDRGQGLARVVRLREGERLPEPHNGPEPRGRENGRREKEQPKEEVEVEIEVETPGSIAAAAAAAAAAPPERPRPPKGHRKVVRAATAEDLQRDGRNRDREAEAFTVCQGMIAERELPMKLIRAEYSFDGSRITFYFFSETRIDFRELVKDLAHKLRSRIEMRQVGVRDVARMIGGFGPCGRELCCTSFLRGFEPVSIRMAKKQEMVLNPAKISGVCGRLLCCLSYEFAMYDDIKKDVAEMKQTAAREKQAEQEKRLAEQRREAEEQRQAEEQRRQEEETRRQEQRQRDRQRQQEQKGQKQEKRKEGRPEQRQQQGAPQQKQQQQKPQKQQQGGQPRPEQKGQPAGGPPPAQGAQAQPQREKGEGAGGRRKRRFWRRKKGGGGGGQQPGGGGGGAPAGGA